MRRAVIVGNTPLPPPAVLDPWLRRADAVWALDGASKRLLDAGIEPDRVLGDMDSTPGSVRRRLPEKAFVPLFNPEKTDLEKALDYARDRKFTDVTIVGATEGRVDHTLATVSLVLRPWTPRWRLRLVDAHFVSEPVHSRLTVRAAKGTPVSLWSPEGARGVTTQGLRWALRGEELVPGGRGVHNEVASSPATVLVAEGNVLLMRGHRVQPHA